MRGILRPAPWDAAIAAGVVTHDEADTFREHVLTDGWALAINQCGLDEAQRERLAVAVAWFTSCGGTQ